MNTSSAEPGHGHCDLDLNDYNYSLYRAILASCNEVDSHAVARALIVGFAGATFWICSELIVQLAYRFTNWRTMYPWMILVSTLGTATITGAHILNHFGNAPAVSLALEATAWVSMVTGFALVLFSRLHILIQDKKTLRICLAIIIIDAMICHPPVIVASIYTGVHRSTLLRAGFCLDVLFVLQENGFALLYIYSFVKFVGGWKTDIQARAVLRKLVLAEIVVFCADIVPLSLLYAQAYVPREAIHPFCYAVKLTIEFWILNDLVRYSHLRQGVVNEEAESGLQGMVTPAVENTRALKMGITEFGYPLPATKINGTHA